MDYGNWAAYDAYQARVAAEVLAALEALDAVDQVHHWANYENRVRDHLGADFPADADFPAPYSGGCLGRVAAGREKIAALI